MRQSSKMMQNLEMKKLRIVKVILCKVSMNHRKSSHWSSRTGLFKTQKGNPHSPSPWYLQTLYHRPSVPSCHLPHHALVISYHAHHLLPREVSRLLAMSSPCVLSSPPLPPSQDFDQPGWHSFQVQLYVGCEVDLGERDVETCPRRGQRRERRERGWLADREYRLALRRVSRGVDQRCCRPRH